MDATLTERQLVELGITQEAAVRLVKQLDTTRKTCSLPEKGWAQMAVFLSAHEYPFSIHALLFSTFFPNHHEHPEQAIAWIPSDSQIENANITQFMHELSFTDLKSFHQFSSTHYTDFWERITKKLNIHFKTQPKNTCDLSQGIESPMWFAGAKMNIVDSCLNAEPHTIALVYQNSQKELCTLSYEALTHLSNRVANGLIALDFQPGDAIAIAMPMNHFAVAIYLGIIKMGGVVVSIADSFSSQEMSVRLQISHARAVFTQDFTQWGGKKLSLYEKLIQAEAPCAIVLPCEQTLAPLRAHDYAWQDFLSDITTFNSATLDPMQPVNILFSSGTTGDPKAIIWNHSTPIKAASDAYFHQNIQPGDVLCWPTNLGWMMGPWVIFAALINRATLAIYSDAPKDRAFGEFVQQANVTMLGVVPTLVAMWRQTQCMEKLDWRAIKVFSSTGECSNANDMLYLMHLAHYKPVIEYCGGTEIGGAYVSSTVIEKNCPSLFSTPTMGLNFCILDESGQPASMGEVAIIPPSIGLSTELLNADHHHVYYEAMPKTAEKKVLRRHGDQIQQFDNGYYCILGRADDTMNLGGIKISAAEIERALTGLPDILEVAAIGVAPPGKGPCQLVIYAATGAALDKLPVMKDMQKRVNQYLNPLFKIHDVIFVTELPKTASNKIMRRLLRK